MMLQAVDVVQTEGGNTEHRLTMVLAYRMPKTRT